MASPHSSSSSSMTHNTNPFASLSSADSPPAATIAMINIRAHVPVVLSVADANFRQWRTFFDLTFEKFGLQSHVDGSLDAVLMRHDPEWLQIDASIVSWLYTSIDKGLMDAVYKPRNSAYDVWTAVCNFFLNNSLSRAVLLQQEFHSLYQGDMSIGEYCGTMKTLADKLYDVGAAVTDQNLVINTLRGLNAKFHPALSVLSASKTPPTFQEVHNYLLQEERYMTHRDKMETATALMATAGSGSSTTTPKPAAQSPSNNPTSAPQNSGTGGYRRKKRKSNDGKPRSSNTNGSAPSAPAGNANQQWGSVYNPWTGVVQAWQLPQPWRPPSGVLGTRPGAPPPHAMTAVQAPQYHGDASGTSVPPALYNALHGASAQVPYGGNGGGDWFFDTGASTHMASNPGPSNQDGSSPM